MRTEFFCEIVSTFSVELATVSSVHQQGAVVRPALSSSGAVFGFTKAVVLNWFSVGSHLHPNICSFNVKH